jgi:DNA-binding CsgD family transcriptional regulator
MTDYATLKKQWYSILKESGFEDIESPNGMLKHNRHAPRTDSGSKLCQPLVYEITTAYFSRASEYLHNGTFLSDVEKTIWELHCEGYSLRETAKELKTSLRNVFLTMRRLKQMCDVYFQDKETT